MNKKSVSFKDNTIFVSGWNDPRNVRKAGQALLDQLTASGVECVAYAITTKKLAEQVNWFQSRPSRPNQTKTGEPAFAIGIKASMGSSSPGLLLEVMKLVEAKRLVL